MTDLLIRAEGLRRDLAPQRVSPAWVLILGGRVNHIAPMRPDAVPEGIPEARAGWLVEPLADSHVHLFLSGDFDPVERRRVAALPRHLAVERALDLLSAYREVGIAAVRDGGDPHGIALAAALRANRDPDRYAAVLPAGEPVFRSGCYGSFLGTGVDDLASAANLLERNVRAGATHAKLLATGLNGLDRPGPEGPPQFSPAEIEQIIAGARELGVGTMVHANGPSAGILLAKPASLEHGFWQGEEDLRALARGDTLWTPTLHAWAALEGRAGLTAEQVRVVRSTHRRHLREVAKGRRLGVRLAAGSDAGTPGAMHGSGLLAELRRLLEAGLSRRQVLQAAWNSRHQCERELGRILGGLAPGGPAGFIWVDGDPAEDLEHLAAPRGVFLGGRLSLRAGQDTRSIDGPITAGGRPPH